LALLFQCEDRKAKAILSSFARAPYSPRAQEADDSLFFQVQTDLARTDDAQMPWPEIVDRSTVEILLDDGRADV
jgi:hypothetical protein